MGKASKSGLSLGLVNVLKNVAVPAVATALGVRVSALTTEQFVAAWVDPLTSPATCFASVLQQAVDAGADGANETISRVMGAHESCASLPPEECGVEPVSKGTALARHCAMARQDAAALLADVVKSWEKLDKKGALLREPKYLISHAWGNPIIVMLDTVLDFLRFADREDTHVWIDWVAVALHGGTARSEDLSGFEEVVKACSLGTIAVTCVPTSTANAHPGCFLPVKPHLRLWCMYEWRITLEHYMQTGNGGLHFPGLIPLARARLLDDIIDKHFEGAASECARADARDLITASIDANYGGLSAFDIPVRLFVLLDPLSSGKGAGAGSTHVAQAADSSWDLSAMHAWMDDADAGRLLVIQGPPGSGKSSIATHMLAKSTGASCAGSGSSKRISASHFLDRQDARSLDLARMVKSIAFQLATR